MRKYMLFLLLLCVQPFYSFGQDATKIIDELLQKMNRVKDYSVQANIKSNIPLIKILPVNATVYFEAKDKFRVISKDCHFAQAGFHRRVQNAAAKDSYNAFVSGQENIRGTKADIVTVLPNRDTSDLILAKLWVDSANDLVLKTQITSPQQRHGDHRLPIRRAKSLRPAR
ncbi:MAG: hypothetical protein IPL65_17130 [Lewinellaceae bacterium]|nr:hypothetical protein [Lewinellaceae bacterium]